MSAVAQSNGKVLNLELSICVKQNLQCDSPISEYMGYAQSFKNSMHVINFEETLDTSHHPRMMSQCPLEIFLLVCIQQSKYSSPMSPGPLLFILAGLVYPIS